MKILVEQLKFGGKEFLLTNQRALFWEEKDMLILSDFHLGKASHFRRNGISIPTQIQGKDLKRFENLIHHFEAKEILVVGDLIHADTNGEVKEFFNWLKKLPHLKFRLVKGNHDRYSDEKLLDFGVHTVSESFVLDGICFQHKPFCSEQYHISGHIHPGINLKLPTRKYLKLPCYVVTETQLILPAFSEFTGYDTQNLPKEATYYVFYQEGIFPFQL